MGIIRLIRRLLYLGFAVIAVTVIAVLWTTYDAMDRFAADRDIEGKLDTVIVLAGGIDGDGVLSFKSRRRVRTAVWLLQNGVTDRLILSGGRRSEKIITAELMATFAAELGADPKSLIKEGQSRTTWENLRFSYALLDPLRDQRIGLLTDASHMTRSRVLNAYLGGPDITPIAAWGQFHSRTTDRVAEIGRETMAWWYNLGKILAWEVAGWAGYSEEDRAGMIF